MNLIYLLAVTSLDGSQLPHVRANDATLQTILSIVFGIIGALALLIVVISGFRYITSGGDPQRTADAKNGIIYALVGLTVAILAQTIVFFVVRRV